MSTFKQKRELKSTIKRLKESGASMQEIGRVQYKLNQLTADPKGNAVKTKVKTSTGGAVRTKPTSTVKKKRATAKVKAPAGHPSGGRSTVKITGLNGKSKTVPAGSGKVIDIKSEGSTKTIKGAARSINGVGPNAALNKRIAALHAKMTKAKAKKKVSK